jgi:acyl transferase domain-containing protein
MSGRFSGSKNVEELWAHLLAGHDLVRPVSRFDLSSFYKDASLGSYCDRGSFIDGVDKFDPVFFSISGLEATYMDPQQRLFLEEAWKT